MDINKMVKSMVITEPGKMEMREFPRPVIGDDDALMKIEMVSVCGTEHGIYTGKNKVTFPMMPGHECIGRIEEIGKNKSKNSGIKVGDRVVVETRFGCGVCEQCMKGHYAACDDAWGYGYAIPCTVPPYLWGAYGEYLYIPARAILHKISEDVTPEVGTLTTAVLGNGINWLSHKGGCKLGDTVVIMGCGRQGLVLVVAALESGASKVIITGTRRSYAKLEMAKELGAHEIIVSDEEDVVQRVTEITDGKMADVVIDVAGQVSTGSMTIQLVKKYGTIVIPGVYGSKPVPFDIDQMIFKEAKIIGVHSHDIDSTNAAIKIIESGKYPLEKLITHKFPLEEAEKAVRIASRLEDDGTPPIDVLIVPDKSLL